MIETALADTSLAASGKELPPVLPPDEPTLPEQIVAVVLGAMPAKMAMESAVAADSTVLAHATRAPALPAHPGLVVERAAVLPVFQSAPGPAAADLPTASLNAEPLPSPILSGAAPMQAAPGATGNEPFRQHVVENLSRLSAATEAVVMPGTSAPLTDASPSGHVLTAASSGLPVSIPIPVPVGHTAWGQAMGQQVVWAVNQQLSSADLHLSPPDLGPVSVRIKLDADQALISFAAAHGAVREAIEAALPRLRDMLAQQGIVLADAQVTSQEQFQHARREAGDRAGADGTGRGEVAEHTVEAPRAVRSLRLLDTYA